MCSKIYQQKRTYNVGQAQACMHTSYIARKSKLWRASINHLWYPMAYRITPLWHKLHSTVPASIIVFSDTSHNKNDKCAEWNYKCITVTVRWCCRISSVASAPSSTRYFPSNSILISYHVYNLQIKSIVHSC